MRKLLLATICGLACSSPSWAQQPPQTYTFAVSAENAQRILNKMSEMPWKDVNDLMQSLIGQVKVQNTPPVTVPSPPPAPLEPHAPPAPADPKE